ncbi:MAG: hypothetical protein IIA34_14485 [Proteobacteria bacterium]|nr:hypothetical protein [Pseudomonadota bacterium]
MRDAARKPWETAVRVARANRRRASESLDDALHRPRLPSYPADRPRDLYGSLSTLLGMSPPLGEAAGPASPKTRNSAGFFEKCDLFVTVVTSLRPIAAHVQYKTNEG